MLARPLNTIPRTVNDMPMGRCQCSADIIDRIIKHAPETAKQIDANLKLLIFLFPIIIIVFFTHLTHHVPEKSHCRSNFFCGAIIIA